MSQPIAADHAVQQLLTTGEHLPRELRKALAGYGEAAIPPLMAMLDDLELADEAAPGGGWAPVHAAVVLGDMRAVPAIGSMLRAFAVTGPLDYLQAALLVALPKIGAPAVDPVLLAYAAETDDHRRAALASVLARCRVRDERILAALLECLQDMPVATAGELAVYGDPAALPALMATFDAIEIIENGRVPDRAFVEVRHAIEALGGTLTDDQVDKFEHAMAAVELTRLAIDVVTRAPARRIDRPERNQPCWCGTGTKYKKCHLQSDEDGSTAPPQPS